MTRTLIVLAAILALSAPMAIAAPPDGKGKPDNPGKSAAAPGQSADKNAAKKCKAMRKDELGEFKEKYGAKPNAFGKCVAAQKKKTEAAEEAEEARENAAKKCKKERDRDPVKFKNDFAPAGHPNGANAFGKCVSKLSKKATS